MMPKRLTLYLVSKCQNLSNRWVYAALLTLSLFLRFPFFFRDYIDRDESTFILLGQAWADGHLPYTALWDLKPPLTFLFFKIIILIFGKSFFAIRAAGAIMVFITAFFTYKIGTRVSSEKLAFWAALACVALQSLFGNIQGVMSEHICMAFLMPSLYLIVRYKSWQFITVAGILMGIALMTKLNVAYVALFGGVYLTYHHVRRKDFAQAALFAVLYGAGILLVVAGTWLPYYRVGLSEFWYRSVFEAAINYSKIGRDSFFSLVPFLFLLTGFFVFSWKKNYLDFRNFGIQMLTVATLGVLYSFFAVGRINSHYLIQLYPIAIVPVLICFSKMEFFLKLRFRPYFLILPLLLPVETYNEYIAIALHKIKSGSFYNEEGFSVPQYLFDNNIPSQNIMFLEYHIGYWLLDTNPPTKAATHPSNLGRMELFSSTMDSPRNKTEELQHIMEYMCPDMVITRLGRSIFDAREIQMNTFMNKALEENYRIIDTIGLALLHRGLGQVSVGTAMAD